MTNPDGNAGETPPSDPGSQPSEPLSGGYEAPSIEHSQDQPHSGGAQPSYELGPQSYEASPPYPPAIDYPADIPHDYAPPPPYPGAAGYPPPYPPPVPGYPPPPGYGMPGYPAYPTGPGYPGGYGMSPSGTTNSVAIGSLVASIMSLPLLAMCAIGLLPALVGIGLGITALNQITRSEQAGFGPQGGQSGFGPQGGQSGRGLAIAGIIIGVLGTLLNGGWILLFLIGISST
ncbi:DUF4190 domain-containing protein [Mycobacterium sp. DL99]|uniref:DUF4190 domain-containing protein n=1 Tax=Mycobacterium sp. DL99 TaxID=2528957 RepID=UPI00108228F1|nr:DUF4190 domain-containing protein [Mycobacterium sp. DL99]